MTLEWYMLVLLVPLVVIPVVMLFAYAGCNQVFGLDPTTLNFTPVNVEAEAESIESIRISWLRASSEPVTFKVFRITPGAEAEFATDATEYLDTGLTPNTEYTYEVLAIRADDFRESDRSESATARTLDYMPAFSATLTTDQTGIGGFCLVQRIEPLRLVRSGNKVRITLQGSTTGNLLIDRVTISQVAPSGNVYDSALDLTEIANSVSIPASQTVELPAVPYTLDHTKPLLVAFDISSAAGMGNVRFVNPVPGTDASMHFRAAAAEAGTQDRLPSAANPGAPPYNASTSIYLVQRIDVG